MMNSVTICAPGPSLKFNRPSYADICVNFAGEIVCHDWLVCNDVLPGSPRLLPCRHGVVTLSYHVDWWREKTKGVVVPLDGYKCGHNGRDPFAIYNRHEYFSSITAICFAVCLARQRMNNAIICYGYDLDGDTYADGNKVTTDGTFFARPGQDNLKIRWELERRDFAIAVEYAKKFGICVLRAANDKDTVEITK